MITVPDFAHRIGARYQRALDMVLAGEVEGVREGRRWMVYLDAAEALASKREADRAPAAA
jgi:hypothetical protein